MLWVVLVVAALVLLGGLAAVWRRGPAVRGRRGAPPAGRGGTRRGAGSRGGRAATGPGRGGQAGTRSTRGGRAGTARGDRAGAGHGDGRRGTRIPGPSRRGKSAGGSGPDAPAQAGPAPGEIWWADVPYEDAPGSKVRPCVVLRAYRGGAEVLKITSQDRRDRSDHIEIPTRTWDPDADHNSFLDLSGPVHVASASFDNRAGVLDSRAWTQVRRIHGV
ncbi:type II toxin-antitoxin system PemK/MazF family toxin [Microbispora sp. NPDC049125]|uniref:type II toxin-antitoxin system PemK/MazF family toxin n=1 Tax=Microbispora sp. NPDC049125 TaxID=3154929 RepID=UPI003467BC06